MATRDRVYIDKELVDVADRLVLRKIPGSESAQGVFRDTRELVGFAAGLCYRKGKNHKRKVVTQGREIKLSAMEGIEIGGTEFVDALAIADTGGVGIVAPDQAVMKATILEEYLNGGLEYISGIAGEEMAITTVVDIIKSEHAPEEAVSEVLGNLSSRKLV